MFWYDPNLFTSEFQWGQRPKSMSRSGNSWATTSTSRSSLTARGFFGDSSPLIGLYRYTHLCWWGSRNQCWSKTTQIYRTVLLSFNIDLFVGGISFFHSCFGHSWFLHYQDIWDSDVSLWFCSLSLSWRSVWGIRGWFIYSRIPLHTL